MSVRKTGPNRFVIDTDEGWFLATVLTEDGASDIKLDLYRAHNTYARLCEEHGDETERGDAWVKWLAENGVPKLSHTAAFQLATEIVAETHRYHERYIARRSAETSGEQTGGAVEDGALPLAEAETDDAPGAVC